MQEPFRKGSKSLPSFLKGLQVVFLERGALMIQSLYDYYVKSYVEEKGQNLIEYALLLAIIVGVGYLIFSQTGIQKDIGTIFMQVKKMIPMTAYTPIT